MTGELGIRIRIERGNINQGFYFLCYHCTEVSSYNWDVGSAR